MQTSDIIARRFANQHLLESRSQTPVDVVRWLVGVQGQDYAGGKWSIGLRMSGGTDSDIEQAVIKGAIIRTWAMRGTLHFVAADDIHWLLDLIVPIIFAGNARRYRQLDLDDETFARSNAVIREALQGSKPLTRKELIAALERAGISADGQRAPYLLQRAALTRVICCGPKRGSEVTYILLGDRVPPREQRSRAEALTELATRYVTSRGPVTLQDFVWWSGLPTSDARSALASVKSPLIQQVIANQTHYLMPDAAGCDPGALLLPTFDEYLLGYKDRSAVLEPAYAKLVNAGGGLPKPTVLISGRVRGTWHRTVAKGRATIRVTPFGPLSAEDKFSVVDAVAQYGAFLQLPIGLIWGSL